MPRIPATKSQTAEPTKAESTAEAKPAVKPAAAIQIAIESVMVEVPLGPSPTGHVSRDLRTHLNSQLTMPQSLAVARLAAGLRQTASKLADGRPVLYNADAVRWLLEQIGTA